jgi:hypothetical protein
MLFRTCTILLGDSIPLNSNQAATDTIVSKTSVLLSQESLKATTTTPHMNFFPRLL